MILLRTLSAAQKAARRASWLGSKSPVSAQSARSAARHAKEKNKALPIEQRVKKWNFHKGDKVVMMRGKDKGKTGEVLAVRKNRNEVFVSGINLKKKTVPYTTQGKGGVYDKEAPVDYSALRLADPETGKPTKIYIKFQERKHGNYEEVRISKLSNKPIPKQFKAREKYIAGPKDTAGSHILGKYTPSMENESKRKEYRNEKSLSPLAEAARKISFRDGEVIVKVLPQVHKYKQRAVQKENSALLKAKLSAKRVHLLRKKQAEKDEADPVHENAEEPQELDMKNIPIL